MAKSGRLLMRSIGSAADAFPRSNCVDAVADRCPPAENPMMPMRSGAMCHSAALASKGIAFDSPASIKRHAQQMYQQTVVLKVMPLNNATQITAGERDLLKRWYEEGAPVE